MEVIQGRGARRCGCRAEDSRRRLLESSRIPRRYEGCTLQSYRPAPGNASQLLAFNLAFRLVCEYPAVERGLLLTGPCGVGKTHLAVAVLRGLLEKGVPCLFYECGALLKEIQETYRPSSQVTESGVLSGAWEAEVLVLDELGAVKPTDWARDTFTQIIGKRYNDRRITIFTTNYSDGRSQPSEETLEDRIGVRLRSRLYEMCRTLVVKGEDYRQRHEEGPA
jgi:DNA replication protein DnaC